MAKRKTKAVASKKGGFSFRRMLADLGSMKRLLAVCFAAVIASKICLAFAPSVAGSITDSIAAFVVSGGFDIAFVGRMCLVLAVLYLVGYGDEALTVETWLSPEGLPVRGELLYDGVRCLTAEITEFQLNQ